MSAGSQPPIGQSTTSLVRRAVCPSASTLPFLKRNPKKNDHDQRWMDNNQPCGATTRCRHVIWWLTRGFDEIIRREFDEATCNVSQSKLHHLSFGSPRYDDSTQDEAGVYCNGKRLWLSWTVLELRNGKVPIFRVILIRYRQVKEDSG